MHPPIPPVAQRWFGPSALGFIGDFQFWGVAPGWQNGDAPMALTPDTAPPNRSLVTVFSRHVAFALERWEFLLFDIPKG